MSRPTNVPSGSVASLADFEFAALEEACNYRRALVRQFAPRLRGRVLEIGAGIGQLTGAIRALPDLTEVVSVEPEPRFWPIFRAANQGQTLIEGTVSQVPSGGAWDAILSVNVLEHIRDDEAELRAYFHLLAPAGGSLCLFVPARAEIYAPIDRDFGHFRRYDRTELGARLRHAGFAVDRIHYFNLAGYFGWWLNFRILRKRRFDATAVRWFDRFIFPPTHWMETCVAPPPVGQSLLVIARAR